MKILKNTVLGQGGSVVALLYKNAPEVSIDKAYTGKNLPKNLTGLDKTKVDKVVGDGKEGLLNKGDRGDRVQAWQEILVQAMAGQGNSDAFNKVKSALDSNEGGYFGTNTEILTQEFQRYLENILDINNPDSIIEDKTNVVIGPEMKAILKFLVGEETVNALNTAKKEAESQKDEGGEGGDAKKKKEAKKPEKKAEPEKEKGADPAEEAQENGNEEAEEAKAKEVDAVEPVDQLEATVIPESVTRPSANIAPETSQLIGSSPSRMTSVMKLEDRQRIVKELPKEIRIGIIAAEPSKHAATKGADYFGGTDGQNEALYNYLSHVVQPVESVDHKGVQITPEAADSLAVTDMTVVRTLRKTGRYQQVKKEMGVGKNMSIADHIRLIDDVTRRAPAVHRATAFEHDFRLKAQEAVDGKLLEGGVLGLFQAGLKKLSGKTSVEGGLDDLATKYNLDPEKLKTNYSAYVDKMAEYDAFLTNPTTGLLGTIGAELGLDKPGVIDRLRQDRSYATQIRRFLARDLLTGLMGAVPITHLRLNFLQKDVHNLLGYGQASQEMINANALEEMKGMVKASEKMMAANLDRLKGRNYSALTNPRLKDVIPSTLSSNEIKEINSLKAAAAAIGITINGGDGKPGAIEISVFDGDLLKKHSYGFFESFPIFGGDSSEVRKVNDAFKTLDGDNATHAKIEALKTLSKAFKREFYEDFARKNAENVDAIFPTLEVFQKVPYKSDRSDGREAFVRSQASALNLGFKYTGDYIKLGAPRGQEGNENVGGKRIPGYSNIPNAEVKCPDGGYKYDQNAILIDHYRAKPELFLAYCNRFGLNPEVKNTMSNDMKDRISLMQQFSRSSGYTETLLKAHHSATTTANALEKGNDWEKQLMGMLNRVHSFSDLKNYDFPIDSSIEPLLKSYYSPGKKTEAGTLVLIKQLKQHPSMVQWAKEVADYLNGNKSALVARHNKVAGEEARSLTNNALKRLEKRRGVKYAGDLDKILGQNPTRTELADYVQHTEVSGTMLSQNYSNQIFQLTGANISPRDIIASILANAKDMDVSGHNTGFKTKIARQNNWKGGSYVFTVPAKEPYSMVSSEGRVVRRMTEYTFAIRPECSNIVLLDETGKQIEACANIADDHLMAEHGRLLIAVAPRRGGGSRKGGEEVKDGTDLDIFDDFVPSKGGTVELP